jgi:hypothetical protein
VLVCPDWWPGFIEGGIPLSEIARIGWGEAMETGHAEFGGDKESRRGWTTAFLEAALAVEPPSYVRRMIEADLGDLEPAWQAELRERDVDGALVIEAE